MDAREKDRMDDLTMINVEFSPNKVKYILWILRLQFSPSVKQDFTHNDLHIWFTHSFIANLLFNNNILHNNLRIGFYRKIIEILK